MSDAVASHRQGVEPATGDVLGYIVVGRLEESGEIVAYVDDSNEHLFATPEDAQKNVDDNGGLRPGVSVWFVPVALDRAIAVA